MGAQTHRDKVASARIGNLLGKLSSFSWVVDQVEVVTKPDYRARELESQPETPLQKRRSCRLLLKKVKRRDKFRGRDSGGSRTHQVTEEPPTATDPSSAKWTGLFGPIWYPTCMRSMIARGGERDLSDSERAAAASSSS